MCARDSLTIAGIESNSDSFSNEKIMVRLDATHVDFKKEIGKVWTGLVVVRNEVDEVLNACKGLKESCDDLKTSSDNISLRIDDMENRINQLEMKQEAGSDKIDTMDC